MTQTTPIPADLSEIPLWRLLVLLDDLERTQGASSDDTRRVAVAVTNRLGVISLVESDRGEEVTHA